MSTILSSSGMAVLSFDFSSQATCPNDRPKSLAQTLTECNSPRPFRRSWLHRAVNRQNGLRRSSRLCGGLAQRPQPVREACLERARLQRRQDPSEHALARRPVEQVERPEEELLIERGPLGDRVGRLAPASTAVTATTTTLTESCCRLTVERGSSNSSKCRTTSSNANRRASAIVRPPSHAAKRATRRAVYQRSV
jgi:hypothetical protein